MSDCSCIYVGDYSPPEFYFAYIRKARKEHICLECKRKILPGENYERVSAKYEGWFADFKTCSDCIKTREAFFCEGWFHEGIWDAIHEHLLELNGKLDEDCIASLTPLGREKVCKIIEEIWEGQGDEE